MWKKLQRLFIPRIDNVLGIDIGSSTVKAVEVVWSDDRPILKNFGIADLPDGIIEGGCIVDGDALTEIIRHLLGSSGITSNNAVVAVSARQVFIRELVFPVMTREELLEAIKWDMEKYFPGAPDTYYFDFSIVGSGANENEMRVLLIAAPKEMVNNLVKVIKNLGIKPLGVDAEPLAIQRTLMSADNALVIDMGAITTQVSIFQGGSPVLTRPIDIGGRTFTGEVMRALELEFSEAERFKCRQKKLLQWAESYGEETVLHQKLELAAGDLAREIRRSVEYYQIKNKQVSIDNIFLTGGGAKLDGLVQYLTEQLDRPVQFFDPSIKLDVHPSLNRHYVREAASQLAVAIGLALHGGESRCA